jgi:hypothetical protein
MANLSSHIMVTDALDLDDRSKALFDEALAHYREACRLQFKDGEAAEWHIGLYRDTARRCLNSILAFGRGVYANTDRESVKAALVREFTVAA